MRKILSRSGEELEKIGVKVSSQFTDALVRALYRGNGSRPLSGRNISKLLLVSMGVLGKKKITVKEVVDVARWMMLREEKKEESHARSR